MLPPSTVSFPLRAASTMHFNMVDEVGIEPTQAYLYAGDLQSLELSIAQLIQKLFQLVKEQLIS